MFMGSYGRTDVRPYIFVGADGRPPVQRELERNVSRNREVFTALGNARDSTRARRGDLFRARS